jgi:UPF0271 protein
VSEAVDLSADLGEGFGRYQVGSDEELLRCVSSANIACGFHAGDPLTMRRAVAGCLRLGVAIGAHPGFPDLRGFGRRFIDLPPAEVTADVIYQVGALAAFARVEGGRLAHVSPHGKLGNLVVSDEGYAIAVADAVEAFDPELLVMTYAGGELARICAKRGLRVVRLGAPDRAYTPDGQLVDRTEPDALVRGPEEIAERAVQMAVDGAVTARGGSRVSVSVDSILLHGDGPGAIAAARAVAHALRGAGVQIRPPAGTPSRRGSSPGW